jgi:hypothetical protein
MRTHREQGICVEDGQVIFGTSLVPRLPCQHTCTVPRHVPVENNGWLGLFEDQIATPLFCNLSLFLTTSH